MKATVILIVLLLAMAFLGWRCNRWWNPTFETVAVSDSPDGHFRYVVELRPPAGFKDSPNIYRGRVIDIQTGKTIPGTKWERDMDSCRDSELEKPHIWTQQEVDDLRSRAGGAGRTQTAPSAGAIGD